MDWETTEDVDAMLEAVRNGASGRKLLLFACGCCRQVKGVVPGIDYLANRLERDADQTLTQVEKVSIVTALGSAILGDYHPMITQFLANGEDDPWRLAKNVAILTRMLQRSPHEGDGLDIDGVMVWSVNSKPQSAILRELFANPFEAISFDAAWRTETAIGLAHAIEADEAWDRMPILADALQDAGCELPPVLDHCRSTNVVHRKGCWVLDMVLGRA